MTEMTDRIGVVRDGIRALGRWKPRLILPRAGGIHVLSWVAICAGIAYVVIVWDQGLSDKNTFIIYFGRPGNILEWSLGNWYFLLGASAACFLTATFALFLAGIGAIILLTAGLINAACLRGIEWIAAASQTIPLLVIVTITVLLERALFQELQVDLPTGAYSLLPIAVSLVFPPLLYGVHSAIRTQIQIKYLLRLWQPTTWWRISRVYLPGAVPDILTGLRTSATWAVGATLITEGLITGVSPQSDTLGKLMIQGFKGDPGQTPTIILISTLLAFMVYYVFVLFQNLIERFLLGSAVQSERAFSLN